MTESRYLNKSANRTKLKICLVSPLPPPLGGIARWTTLVHDWATDNPLIYIAQVDISPRWRAIEDLSKVKRVIGGGLQLLRDYCRFIAAVRGADVVHLTTSGQLAIVRDLAICATARILKTPVFYHLHFGRIPEIARTNTLEWRMLLRAMKLAKVILPLDGTSAQTVRDHLPHHRVETTPNPIDLAKLPSPSPRPSERKTLLFMGWVIPSKGVEDLLLAWDSLSYNDWDLVLVGSIAPSYMKELSERFPRRNMHFTGEVSHDSALQLMADCDLFVLPSHTEAFPFVVLEAMALGKAIIASDVGAIPEMLAGDCGLLVKPRDVESLIATLKSLMEDGQLRQELGLRAHERALACYARDAVFAHMQSIWTTEI